MLDPCIYIRPWLSIKRVHLQLFQKSWHSWQSLSWQFPSTGPYNFAINPFGATTDWNFRAWTFLCPLHKILWNSFGLDISLTVPSTNPQQFPNAAPLSWTAFAYNSKFIGESKDWLKVDSKWPQSLYILSVRWLHTIDSCGIGLANIGTMSTYLQG